MKGLDRKIAELKGWRHVPAGTETVMRGSRATLAEGYVERLDMGGEWYHAGFNCNWSGSDSKALELVDDLDTQCFIERFGQPNWKWAAVFIYRTPGLPGPTFRAEGTTRPEAICRAYIAAREFLNQKGR